MMVVAWSLVLVACAGGDGDGSVETAEAADGDHRVAVDSAALRPAGTEIAPGV